MISNLKVLGLAFIAVLAMSAIGTSAAQAAPEFTCSSYPCTATGTGTGTFTVDQHGTVQCSVHYLLGKLAGASSTATVTTTFSDCTAFGFVGTVHKKECDHLLHATENVSPGVYRHHLDIVCPSGSPGFVITAGGCEIDILPQTGLTTVKTTNLAGGTVTIEHDLSNITANVTKDPIFCPMTGPGHKKATYQGDAVLAPVGVGSFSVSG
jgi:hypothetical protein